MQTLNLAHSDKGNIHYIRSKFPDGEPYIQITSEINHKDEVAVFTRICNSDDLFILMQVGDILKRHEVKWNLHISYLMSMRMDRVMDFNRPFSLKIVANLINSLNFEGISILEPHSEVTSSFFKARLLPHYEEHFPCNRQWEYTDDNKCIVLPDAGALERYGPTSNFRNYIVFNKIRDVNTGKLTDFKIVEYHLKDDINEYVFIDDLCDGGGTFLGELDILKRNFPKAEYSISVYHNVNPAGVQKIIEHFDYLYTTNSYYDWKTLNNSKIRISEVI